MMIYTVKYFQIRKYERTAVKYMKCRKRKYFQTKKLFQQNSLKADSAFSLNT